MRRMISLATLIAAGLCGVVPLTHTRSETLMDVLGNRDTPSCPRYQRTPSDPCNIVVHRPGGNPTQDMTGSIGHAKSWQAHGGPRCKTICRFTGTQY
jgi:hypothetical protein